MKNNKSICTLILVLSSNLLFCSATSNTNSDQAIAPTTCTPDELKLRKAAQKGDNDVVLELLLKNVNPHTANSNGVNSLHLAAHNGHTAVVLTLLALTKDRKKLLTAKVSDNRSALDLASKKKYTEIIKILTHAEHELTHGSTCITHFSPNILNELLTLINNETKGISCAMYHFTHGDPALAFVQKHQDGVQVELIVDKDYAYNTQTKSFTNKKANLCLALKYMIKKGIKVKECAVASDGDAHKGHFNMHQKFLIFESNNGKPIGVTGSYNFTHQANHNWENVVIFDDAEGINGLRAQFDLMKKDAIDLPLARCVSDKDTSTKDYWSRKNNKVDKAPFI